MYGRRHNRKKGRCGRSAAVPTLCLIVLAVTGAFTTTSARNTTIGHRALAIENPADTGALAVERLDSLIQQAVDTLPAGPVKNRKEALKILRAIDLLLQEKGFTHETTLLLSTSLLTGRSDCDTRTLIYLSIAKVLGYAMVPCQLQGKIPGHVFIRWNIPGKRALDWETLNGAVYCYRKNQGASRHPIRPMTLEEMEAIVHFSVALAWERSGNLTEAGNSFRRALSLYSNEALLHYAHADYLLRVFASDSKYGMKVLDMALAEADRTVELSPAFAGGYTLRAIVQDARGVRSHVLKDLNQAVALDGNDASIRYYRAMALLADSRPTRAIGEFTQAIALAQAEGGDNGQRIITASRVNRGHAYEYRARRRSGNIAKRDLRRAVKDNTAVQSALIAGNQR